MISSEERGATSQAKERFPAWLEMTVALVPDSDPLRGQGCIPDLILDQRACINARFDRHSRPLRGQEQEEWKNRNLPWRQAALDVSRVVSWSSFCKTI
uniref:Uncharacterized protein n=1 Tax=Candidatus Kentrum sp. MB TaxID=2138164 RepID=A0A451BEI1_9GAMM|nr:MAG: hypothetical protein BECKMB1821H_GA0114242_10694 [Candidatus Kentron sp. MB]